MILPLGLATATGCTAGIIIGIKLSLRNGCCSALDYDLAELGGRRKLLDRRLALLEADFHPWTYLPSPATFACALPSSKTSFGALERW